MDNREFNRDFFAVAESSADLVRDTPVLLDRKKYPLIFAITDAMCKEAKIEPISLYHADIKIPHVVSWPNGFDGWKPVKNGKSRMVISNKLLEAPFTQEEAAMYVGHKLGHQFHGIKHVLSKEAYLTVFPAFLALGAVPYINEQRRSKHCPKNSRRNFLQNAVVATSAVAGSALTSLVSDYTDEVRENETDQIAVDLFHKPEVLHSLLLKLRRWCIDNHKSPEAWYPGIGYRLVHAEKLVAEKQGGAGLPHGRS